MLGDNGKFQGGTVPGRLVYAQPVLDRIKRHATAGMNVLRMEPPGSGNFVEKVLLWRPSWMSRRLRMEVYVQVARGWNVADLCRKAQTAIANEVLRLTHYQKVRINVHVSGTFNPGEDN